MASVDTNILVRLLAADHAAQCRAAKSLIERARRAGEPLFVPLSVVLELEWVLRASYGFPKERMCATLAAMLESRELDFQDEATVERALQSYRDNHADFAECLHLACAESAARLPVWTFDRVAGELKGVRVLAEAST